MTMTASAAMMDDSSAAEAWTLELTRAGNDISHATRRLQGIFHDASDKAVEKG